MDRVREDEISELLIDKIRIFEKKVSKPILQVDALCELADMFRDVIYTQTKDNEKELSSAVAISRFQEYLQILKEDDEILEYIYMTWWEKILGYFSMYTPDINDNVGEIRLYGRFLNFMRLGSDGQDPRLIAGPEMLTAVYSSCRKVIRLLESESTINIFKDRIPAYMIQDTEEKQNGGYINARKFNAMCRLIKILDDTFEYIPMQVRSEEVNETAEFSDIDF